MTNFCASGGLARVDQSIDMTGYCMAGYQDYGTSSSSSLNLAFPQVIGYRVPVDPVQSKLDAIRRKSQSEFGEAWSKLAQM